MKTRLVCYREGEIDLVFPLNTPKATIGREADNKIQLPNEKVSKHHAMLRQTEGTWTIEDLNSRNGVFVNGQRTTKGPLKDGDRLKIGPYEFYLEINVPSDDFVPSHIIDVSSRMKDKTITDVRDPNKT